MINLPQSQLVSFSVPRNRISRFFTRNAQRTFVLSEQVLGSNADLWSIDGFFTLADEEVDLDKKQLARIVAQSTNLWKLRSNTLILEILEMLFVSALWKIGGRSLFTSYLCARLDRETLQKLARVAYSLSGYDYFVQSVTLMYIKK